MLHRPAQAADLPAIVELAHKSVSTHPLPGLRIDRTAMAETARALVGNARHFAWVSECGGRVVAAVLAHAGPGIFYRGQQASVVLFQQHVPGACMPLLREFARWVRSRPAIKLAVFELEPEADPRLARALRRMGFARESMTLAYVRSAA